MQGALEAGKIILGHYAKSYSIEYKGEFDIVTAADKASQKKIVSIIEKSFPMHNILAEEGLKKQTDSEFTWVIDPLDGTTNFAHKYPMFCISIALKKQEEIILGVVYNPLNKEIFYSESNRGAFLNNKKISVSGTREIKKCIIATGFPYNKKENPENNLRDFEKIAVSVQGLRRGGAAALDLCYVACGRLDAYWELSVRQWDVAAGILIVKEAGGRVTDFNGNELKTDYSRIVATNNKVHAQLLNIIGG